MHHAARAFISNSFTLLCYAACPSALSPVRRPRLYWFDWSLAPADDFSVSIDSHGLRSISFRPRSAPVDHISWCEPGWALQAGQDVVFPIFTTPRMASRQGPTPAGIQRASSEAIARWQADGRRRPPFHYESWCGLLSEGDPATWRLPSVRERQLLLIFFCFHTEPCFPLPVLRPTPRGSSSSSYASWGIPSAAASWLGSSGTFSIAWARSRDLLPSR